MPGHEHDARVDHLVGDRDRLLRITGVVADLEGRQLLAKHAARGVEILDRHLGALHLIAEDRVLAVIGPAVAIVISSACAAPAVSATSALAARRW